MLRERELRIEELVGHLDRTGAHQGCRSFFVLFRFVLCSFSLSLFSGLTFGALTDGGPDQVAGRVVRRRMLFGRRRSRPHAGDDGDDDADPQCRHGTASATDSTLDLKKTKNKREQCELYKKPTNKSRPANRLVTRTSTVDRYCRPRLGSTTRVTCWSFVSFRKGKKAGSTAASAANGSKNRSNPLKVPSAAGTGSRRTQPSGLSVGALSEIGEKPEKKKKRNEG